MIVKFNIGDWVKRGLRKGRVINRYFRAGIEIYTIRWVGDEIEDGIWASELEETL